MQMTKYTHLGVYGILIEDGKVLLIKKSRGPHKGKWDLPGGTLEFGEDPYDALLREFDEETGLTAIEGVIKTAKAYTIIYPYQEDQLEELHHIGILYTVKRLNSYSPLKTDGDGHDSLGARWIPIEELKSMEITPFVNEVFN